MKTTVPFKKIFVALILLVCTAGLTSNAQSNQLTFRNSSLYSGVAGQDNAVYRFPLVDNNLDAFVKIVGRSSYLVELEDIDITSTGFDKAFQPKISYNNGSVGSARTWWLDFEIKFVNKNTTTPATINSFDATFLDIDGDNNRLREVVWVYNQQSYTLENNSLLQVLNLLDVLDLLTGLLTPGKRFNGSTTDYSAIDTSATRVMATNSFQNRNSFRLRMGGSTTGASSQADRMYSAWFKGFTYVAPIISTLPVKMESFTAVLNNNTNKVDLKWTTSTEINVSHYTIEKSYDGKNFSDAGLVFAYGNTTQKVNYSFSDNINNAQQPIIYYRLRTVDNDTKSQLSETRIIRVGKKNEQLAMVTYPNPVTNELRVTLPSTWQGKPVVLEVFNQGGQRVKSIISNSSSQTETIMVNDLASGFYLVRAACGMETAQQKVIKK